MKEYTKVNEKKRIIKEIKCNKCGSLICTYEDIDKTDYLEINKRWNYFSPYDNKRHKFDLCTKCYHNLINSFKIPLRDS